MPPVEASRFAVRGSMRGHVILEHISNALGWHFAAQASV